jgi:putative transposon-encoded protein
MAKFTISLKGYDSIDRTVKTAQISGRVFVPKAWIGKRVKVILLEPEEEA